VLRHAGVGATADVSVWRDARALQIAVTDDGALGAPRVRGAGGKRLGALGYGIRGMQERAQLYGGEVTATAIPTGGFVVRAQLPLENASTTELTSREAIR
jgi:signal transduction histidine kinase